MINHLTLTILSENRVANPHLIAEQGLSLHIQADKHCFLFDTGQMQAFMQNAQQLNIKLTRLDAVFLSHGHFDLTGGLRYLPDITKSLDVICHPNIFNQKYRIVDGERVNIGVPWEKSHLEAKNVKFHTKASPAQPFESVWISGEIPRLNNYEYIDDSYQERILESYIKDELHDDMSMAFNTVRGLVVLLGCGHSGPVNTIKHLMRITGVHKIHAIIGGMHLHRAPQEKIDLIVQNLFKLNPDFIIPLHCCGFRSIHQMFTLFRERVLLKNVGDVFTVSPQ